MAKIRANELMKNNFSEYFLRNAFSILPENRLISFELNFFSGKLTVCLFSCFLICLKYGCVVYSRASVLALKYKKSSVVEQVSTD